MTKNRWEGGSGLTSGQRLREIKIRSCLVYLTDLNGREMAAADTSNDRTQSRRPTTNKVKSFTGNRLNQVRVSPRSMPCKQLSLPGLRICRTVKLLSVAAPPVVMPQSADRVKIR
jgi:hypothetical protein